MPISTKLATKDSWMKGIKVYSDEVPHSFLSLRVDNCESK